MSVTCTGNGVMVYRWLTARSVVKAWAQGVRMVRPFVMRNLRRELGLGPRAKPEAMLPLIEAKLAEARAALKPGEIQTEGE